MFCPKFGCPKVASSIVSSLALVICASLPAENPPQMKQALRGAVLRTLPPTTQLEPPAPQTLELLREFETVINILLYFCRKILEVNRGT